jgi:hypothetical protein
LRSLITAPALSISSIVTGSRNSPTSSCAHDVATGRTMEIPVSNCRPRIVFAVSGSEVTESG